MMDRLLETSEWRILEKKGESSGIGLRKGFIPEEIKAVDDNVLRFIISTGTLDRDHDTIDPNGWVLDNFNKNPVVLFGHDHRSPPVAKAINTFVEGGNLISDAEFVTADIQEFGAMIYRLYLGKFMRATSVGFMPDEYVWSEEQNGMKFITQELLEYSMVPVPCNPEALQIARSKGIDIAPLKGWCEKLLDEWESGKRSIGVSRKQLEKIVKESDGKNKTYHVSAAKQKELREKNIWEPRLKKWFDEAVEVKEETWEMLKRDWDDEDVPEHIWSEWEEALDVFAEEKQKEGVPTSILDEGSEDEGSEDEGSEDEEFEEEENLDEFETGLEDLQTEFIMLQDQITILQQTNADLESENSDLTVKLGQAMIREGESISPEDLIKHIASAIGKRVRKITGQLD